MQYVSPVRIVEGKEQKLKIKVKNKKETTNPVLIISTITRRAVCAFSACALCVFDACDSCCTRI